MISTPLPLCPALEAAVKQRTLSGSGVGRGDNDNIVAGDEGLQQSAAPPRLQEDYVDCRGSPAAQFGRMHGQEQRKAGSVFV